jgi:hypothetical protein
MCMSIKRLILAVCVLWLLVACQRTEEFPVQLTVPTGATEVRVNENADRSVRELTFIVSSGRNSYLVADQMEDQLKKGGYVRCSSGGGQWEILRRRQGDKENAETRLLRFLKTGEPGRLGAILANEYCNESQNQCEQHFIVRQINIKQSIAEADKYIREICK